MIKSFDSNDVTMEMLTVKVITRQDGGIGKSLELLYKP